MSESSYVILKLDSPNKNNQVFTPDAIKGAMEKWNKEHPDDEMFINAEGNLAMSSRRFGRIENGIFIEAPEVPISFTKGVKKL